MNETQARYLTVKEAASILRLSPITVRRFLAAGIIQGKKMNGGKWIIPAQSLAELGQAKETRSESEMDNS